MQRIARTLLLITFVTLVAGLSADAATSSTWRAYAHRNGVFAPVADRFGDFPIARTFHLDACPLGDLPPAWHVRAALYTDLTRDGEPECALLVWRPWQDWPIMRWSDTPSPIAANRDARGDSAHIILLQRVAGRRLQSTDDPSQPPTNPRRLGYRELWAGSALALPITQIAAGDVDGDGWNELAALEGDYTAGRYGPARHVAVWRWNGFGFTLQWRSPPDRFFALALADFEGDGMVEVLVR